MDLKIVSQFSQDDKLYAETALNIAIDHGIFTDNPIPNKWNTVAKTATFEQMNDYVLLEKMVQAVTKDRVFVDNHADVQPQCPCPGESVAQNPTVEQIVQGVPIDSATESLNKEQHRAYNIITNHLEAHLNGQTPRQVLMMVVGPGGTGKIALLNAITQTFEKKGASGLLAKTVCVTQVKCI